MGAAMSIEAQNAAQVRQQSCGEKEKGSMYEKSTVEGAVVGAIQT